MRYVSTTTAAKALGLGVSTVKRMVDDGEILADRTPKGHRRIILSDLLARIRGGDLPYVDLQLLMDLCGEGEGPRQVPEIADQLLEALTRGDGEQSRALILRAHETGLTIPQLADDVIAPVMRKVGHRWEEGSIDVFHEHRGSQLCLTALQVLKDRLTPTPTIPAPLVALGGSPERDLYEMPSLLAEMMLSEQGWKAVNLGSNTPLASFEKAMREIRPRLLWLSVSYLEDVDRFLREYERLYQTAQELNVAVAVGGFALSEEVRSRMSYVTFGDRLECLAALARVISSDETSR